MSIKKLRQEIFESNVVYTEIYILNLFTANDVIWYELPNNIAINYEKLNTGKNLNKYKK